MRTILLAALLLLSQLSSAQIFKTTDEHGNVSYSDTPPSSGPSEQVKLRETNSAPPPEILEPRSAAPEPAADASAALDYSVTITSPANETTIPMGPGNFSVSAAVAPALGEDMLLQLLVDGTSSGAPQANASWALTNVFRGAHDVTVAVVDSKGKQLTVSGPVRVYVLRPSINFDNKKRPPPLGPTPR